METATQRGTQGRRSTLEGQGGDNEKEENEAMGEEKRRMRLRWWRRVGR